MHESENQTDLDDAGVDPLASRIAQTSFQLKIITAGLAGGAFVFGLISVVQTGGEFSTKPDVISWIALGFAAISLFLSMIIPQVMARTALNEFSSNKFRELSDVQKFERLAPIFMTRHIVGCALLEGAAFFNLVALMTEEFVGCLAAAIVLVVLLLARMPTAARLESWIRERIREIE